MQIGLCLPHFGRPLETGRLLQVAQRADARGLDALWVTDHVIVPKDIHIAYREETTYPAILGTIDVLAREVRPALGG
jgi:alkanesulfonate monooxygenase SsuD/methylene tetrahydromethanopterin reductase-like flavin-dependent oxidoreductase (luciferase family)